MTRPEFAEVMRQMTANWPRHSIPDLAAAKFFTDLERFDADKVQVAIEALFLAGREFPPTSAHIIGEIAEQTESAPEFGEAWDLIHRAIRRHGSHNKQRVVDSLEHPAVAELAAQVGVRELGLAAEGDTTRHAQAREMYRAIVRKRRRELTHAGLPSAAVPALRDVSQPRQIGSAMSALVDRLAPGDDAA